MKFYCKFFEGWSIAGQIILASSTLGHGPTRPPRRKKHVIMPAMSSVFVAPLEL